MKTRFAPSPTGFLHLGSVRTALFAWLMARHHKGLFYLRIEDTDSQRSKPEYTDLILNTMTWLGLNWDGPVEYQSRRYDRYNAVIDELIQDEKAYYCHCSPERLIALRDQQKKDGEPNGHYDGACRNLNLGSDPGSVVRLKVPLQSHLEFTDELHGLQIRDRNTMDDWILRRSDGHPTYNFAVVVDDHDMEITHVIRGDDHLNNTPKQVALYQLMNWPIPLFYHIPMILDEAGGRLSKRSGSANILHYREQGYLPGALLNALVRLGWSHGDQELFSMDEMIALFDGQSLQRSAASFNSEKFYWIAKQWIMKTAPEQLLHHAIAENFLKNSPQGLLQVNLVHQRIKNMGEIPPMIAFLFQSPCVQKETLLTVYPQSDLTALGSCISQMVTQSEFPPEGLFPFLKTYCKDHELPIKNLALPLRHILTGSPQSPDLNEVVKALSLSEVYARVRQALAEI